MVISSRLRQFLRGFAGVLAAGVVSLSVLSDCSTWNNSLIASASLSEGKYLTRAETRALFGDSIEVTYFNGQEYVQTTASYLYDAEIYNTNYSDYVHTGLQGLTYGFSSGSSYNHNDYVSVRLSPQWSIYDTYQLHAVLAVGTSVSSLSAAAFDAPAWVWHVDGQRMRFESRADSNDLFPIMQYVDGWVRSAPFVEVDISSNSAFSASSVDATFTGVLSEGTVTLFIGCPYVSADSTAQTGTIATTDSGGSSGSDSGGGVIGGLIESVIAVLEGLLDGIKSLFVPTLDYIKQWLARVQAVILSAFGLDLYDQIFADFFNSLDAITAGSAILHFPDISFSVRGVVYTILPGRDVPVFQYDLPFTVAGVTYSLSSFIKYAFNLVLTALFINTFCNKCRALIVGETYIVSEEGES